MRKPLLFLFTITALASCSHPETYSDQQFTTTTTVVERPKTAEELRAELLLREQSAPSDYLHVDGKHWRNFVDQLVIEGDVANSATLARFKDPVLSVT